ncbi:MAG: acyltransferase family protein [Cyanobacteria bacterium J06559_3]
MASINPDLSYRRDIDGVRAIAVIAVILFHAGFSLFEGGFVGVDVFLVLSGYLSTQRIIASYEQGGFKYGQFYVRRIMRLFPAMLTTVIGTLIAGMIFLWPDALLALAKSAISALLSVANIYFYNQSGYWDTSSWTKPLLHFWTLAVDEQFYLFWPFIILAILKFFRRYALPILVGMLVASLLITTVYTYRDPSAAFFLTPFRIHEFAIGAVCVWGDRKLWPQTVGGQVSQYGLACIGLAAIIGPIFVLDETYPFPGWTAAIPALGTAFIILAKNPLGLRPLLANPFTSYISLISYSLYLTHWPVIVFTRLQYGPLTLATFGLATLITLVLSILQYNLIETPLRRLPRKRNITLGSAIAGAGLAILLVAGGSVSVIASDGLPNRYSDELRQIAPLTKEATSEERSYPRKQLCAQVKNDTLCGTINPDAVNVLVVGDSHGDDGLNIFSIAFPDANYLIAQKGGCPLVTELTGIDPIFRKCGEYNARRFTQIDAIAQDLDYVVFSQRLSQPRIPLFKDTIDWFYERDIEIIVLGAGPEYRSEIGGVVPMILKHGKMDELDKTLDTHSYTQHYPLDDVLQEYVEMRGGTYLRKRDYFCPDDVCQVVLKDGAPLMFDNHHLSLEASQSFGKYLAVYHNDLLSQRE